MPLKLVLKFVVILSLVHSIKCDSTTGCDQQFQQILDGINGINTRMDDCCSPARPVYKDCKDAQANGVATSGIETINPDGGAPFKVYCDMVTDGGGWTVFQRRLDGTQDFYLNMADYVKTFGDLRAEFWLGLDNINRLTAAAGTANTLRIELEDFNGAKRFAKYSTFGMGDTATKYTLTVGGYTGDDSGDSLSQWHNGIKFSTKDEDNDNYAPDSCAILYPGGWWYDTCHAANLNGAYYKSGVTPPYANGLIWYTWKGYYESLAKTEMKVRS